MSDSKEQKTGLEIQEPVKKENNFQQKDYGKQMEQVREIMEANRIEELLEDSSFTEFEKGELRPLIKEYLDSSEDKNKASEKLLMYINS